MANLLKFFRSATMPSVAELNASIGSIWFDTTKNVIKVRTAENGVDADWEVYGTSPADLNAAIGRIATLEGAVKTLNETTLPALKAELEKAIEDAVATEAAIARKAEEDLGKRIDDLAAAAVSVKEGTINHVKVTKSGTEYTVEGDDIASAQGLADEIKRATDEEVRIAGLVNNEKSRAEGVEAGLQAAINTLNGADTVSGSVAKAVKDAKDSLLGGAQTLTDFAKVETAIAEAEAAAKAAATLLTVDSEGHVTVSGQQDEKTGAWTYTIGENDIASKSVVDTLIGDDKAMSARAIVQDEVAKQLTSENISDSFDTLKEMAEWLSSHPEDVKEMNDAIGDNKTAIEAEVIRATTAEGNLQTAIANEESARKAAIDALDFNEASTGGSKVTVNVTQVDGKITGVTVAESDIASAQALATLNTEVQEHEEVVAATLNDLNERINAIDGRIPTELGVMSVAKGTDGNFVTTTVDNTDAANPKVSVAVDYVDGATAGDKLTTNTYVDEHIAAAINAIPAAHVTDVVGDSASYSVVEAPEAGGVHTVKNTLATITVDDDNKATVTEGLATDSFVKTYVENKLSWASF